MPQPPPPAPVSLLCSPYVAVTWQSWSREAWPTPRAFRWCWFMSISSWKRCHVFLLEPLREAFCPTLLLLSPWQLLM